MALENIKLNQYKSCKPIINFGMKYLMARKGNSLQKRQRYQLQILSWLSPQKGEKRLSSYPFPQHNSLVNGSLGDRKNYQMHLFIAQDCDNISGVSHVEDKIQSNIRQHSTCQICFTHSTLWPRSTNVDKFLLLTNNIECN